MTNELAIYIPAYEAASTLPQVLDRIPANLRQQASEIIVIDNCSQDRTDRIASDYGKTHQMANLQIIRNPTNVGYGGSQKIAYRRCIDKGFEIVAMLHGDAQYAPEFLNALIEKMTAEKADMIFGSRIQGHPLKGGMPLHRYIGNRILTGIQNTLLRTKLSEFHSGYRIYSVAALNKIPFERLSSDYHFDTEIIILMLREKLKIIECPIPTHYGDEKCHVNVWKYGTQVLMTTLTYVFHVKRWRVSRNWQKILGF